MATTLLFFKALVSSRERPATFSSLVYRRHMLTSFPFRKEDELADLLVLNTGVYDRRKLGWHHDRLSTMIVAWKMPR